MIERLLMFIMSGLYALSGSSDTFDRSSRCFWHKNAYSTCTFAACEQTGPASRESREAGRGNLTQQHSVEIRPGGMRACPAGNGKGACACAE